MGNYSPDPIVEKNQSMSVLNLETTDGSGSYSSRLIAYGQEIDSAGIINRIGGLALRISVDAGLAFLPVSMLQPAVTIDAVGNLIITDENNNRTRKAIFSSSSKRSVCCHIAGPVCSYNFNRGRVRVGASR